MAVLAASAALSYYGGKAASKANEKKIAKAMQSLEDNKVLFDSIGIPPIEAQKIVLQQYGLPEDFVPILEKAIELKNTELKGVSFDPELKKTRMDALAKLQGISDAQGMDIQSQVAMDQALEAARQQEQGQREAIETSMQRRGIAGSGIDMALQQQAQQAAANEARRASQLQAAEANARALQALTQGASLAGQMSQEDIALQSAQAQAQDLINQFNAQTNINQQQRNVDRQNVSRLENIRGRESVSRANVDLKNQGDMFNKGLIQQEFQNKMAKAGGIAGVNTGMANIQAGQAPIAAQQASAPYSAISKALPSVDFGTISSMFGDKEDTKKTGEKK